MSTYAPQLINLRDHRTLSGVGGGSGYVNLLTVLQTDFYPVELDFEAGTYYSTGSDSIYQGALARDGTTGIWECTRSASVSIPSIAASGQKGLAFNADKSKVFATTINPVVSLSSRCTIPALGRVSSSGQCCNKPLSKVPCR